MARELRQSTAVDLPIGPFVDSTDGITAETGLTITQPDIRLKKNAAAWAQKNAAQTLSHEENGFYEVTLDATDTNTLGLLRLAVFEAGAMPVWEDFLVITQAEWDAKYSVSTRDADIAAILADTGTDIPATLSVIAGYLDTEVAAIKAKTDNLPSDPADQSLIIAATDALATLIGAIPNADANAAALLDLADGVETDRTVRKALRLILSFAVGKTTGVTAPGTMTFRDSNDTKDRIAATLDASGARTGMTLDDS